MDKVLVKDLIENNYIGVVGEKDKQGKQIYNKFEKIFNQSDGQYKINKEVVSPLIDKFFNGYNATIMAYGASESGKTYTILG